MIDPILDHRLDRKPTLLLFRREPNSLALDVCNPAMVDLDFWLSFFSPISTLNGRISGRTLDSRRHHETPDTSRLVFDERGTLSDA